MGRKARFLLMQRNAEGYMQNKSCFHWPVGAAEGHRETQHRCGVGVEPVRGSAP